MKMKKFFVGCIAVILSVSALDSEAVTADAKALRMAKGTYQGAFRGTVGKTYNNAATFKFMPKAQKRKTKAILNIPGGHTVKIVRITAKVRNNGNKVKFSGGRVPGKGLLPLGIEIRRGRVLKGTVALRGTQPRLSARMFLAGVDLTVWAPGNVSGRPIFKGKK